MICSSCASASVRIFAWTGTSSSPARCAARWRRAPATISKCPLTRRTTSGESTPCVRMLAASSSSRSSSNTLRGLVEDLINSVNGMLRYSLVVTFVSVVGLTSVLSFLITSMSVLLGKQQGGDGAVGFGYDPKLVACRRAVAAEEPEALFKAHAVFI